MESESRLSRIETLWSVVRRAHDQAGSEAAQAQQVLLDQYGGAVRRYLLAALRNEDAADEVFQDFALKFVRGDFEKANPQKGRFRQFVKTVVYRMVVDYQRSQKKDRRHKDLTQIQENQEPTDLEKMDVEFTSSWRSELLARTWTELQAIEAETTKPFFTVLRLRADHAEMRSDELAAALTKILGREVKAGNARVLVHRSREVFAQRLIDLIEDSLHDPSDDEIESELITLDLLAYCKPVLDSRKQKKVSDA